MPSIGLMESVDELRCSTLGGLDPRRQAELGQFFTPAPIALLMAGMFSPPPPEVRLLDPGAGVGSLGAAFVGAALSAKRLPKRIEITSYETDPTLLPLLAESQEVSGRFCRRAGVRFVGDSRRADFIRAAVAAIQESKWGGSGAARYNRIILNPPYRKIRSESEERKLLRAVGIETSNLYSAFVALCIELLEPNGELVAITPRSFCNGPYFKPFRQAVLRQCTLKQMHVFEARDEAFKDDAVLQENVIYHLRKGKQQARTVTISQSKAGSGPVVSKRRVPLASVVNPQDADMVINLVTSRAGAATAQAIASLPCTLASLGVQVSTGRVVDFRARAFLRSDPAKDTAPLVYPLHVNSGRLVWPQPGARKANAIVDCPETADLFVPAGNYVVVRRFSSKEERRRIYASLIQAEDLPAGNVGIENHLNYFHAGGKGLDLALARGLAAYLNTTAVDSYFRQFSGHTQVNATDIRSLRFPSADKLVELGEAFIGAINDQALVDAAADKLIFHLSSGVNESA